MNKFANNNGVNIHYRIYGNPDSKKNDIVMIHGALGSSDDWENNKNLMSRISEGNYRKTCIINLRGHGQSDFPDDGYTVANHISDIVSVIEAEKMRNVVLVAHSLGVSYAVGAALHAGNKIVGFLAGDYVPIVSSFNNSWLEYVTQHIDEFNVNPSLPYKLVEEIENTSFIEDLNKLSFPALVIRGIGDGGMLQDDDSERYWENLNGVQFFKSNTDHEVFSSRETVDRVISFLSDL